MMEHKRSPITIDQVNTSSLRQKRFKAAISLSSKERKEQVGERILALQQLVSPYGKTDTASVLHEAMDYISFLHEQVKVLSAPYLHSTSTAKTQECESYNLRSKGLCLVPTSCTVAVCDTNGADIWAPNKTSSTKY